MLIAGIRIDPNYLQQLQDAFSILRNPRTEKILSSIADSLACNRDIAHNTGESEQMCRFILNKLHNTDILSKNERKYYHINRAVLRRFERIATNLSLNELSYCDAYYSCRSFNSTQRLEDMEMIGKQDSFFFADLEGKKSWKSKRLQPLIKYGFISTKSERRQLFLSLNKNKIRILSS